MQWDDPARIAGGKGAKTDLDLFLFDSENNRVIASSQDSNIGHDPVEIISVTALAEGVSEGSLFIRKSAGDDPLYVKYVLFSSGATERLEETDVPAVELLHLSENGQLETVDGKVMEEGIAVIILPSLLREAEINPGILQIGPGGEKIITRLSDGQRGIELSDKFYPVDTQEQPIWFIPDGYIAQLGENEKIELFADTADTDEQTDVRIAEYATQSSTIYGHPNAAGAIAVGAMSYRQAPWFNGNSLIEKFSSAGGLPMLFNSAGEPLKSLKFRAKPEIVAVDDIDTTFFPFIAEETDSDLNGLPNFRGTSAAAPNAAAVAALLLQKYSYLQPEQVRQVMMQGTVDLIDPVIVQGEYVLPENPCASDVEFDWGTGCGLIQADLIFEVAKNFTISSDLGDFNDDGCVDTKDTGILTAILRSSSDVQKKYDLTGDGKITERDFDALRDLYGNGCSG